MLANLGIVAAGKSADEVMGVRSLCRGNDVGLARSWMTQGDIFANGPTKEESILADKCKMIAQRFAGYARNFRTVDQYRAVIEVIETQQEVKDGRFSPA